MKSCLLYYLQHGKTSPLIDNFKVQIGNVSKKKSWKVSLKTIALIYDFHNSFTSMGVTQMPGDSHRLPTNDGRLDISLVHPARSNGSKEKQFFNFSSNICNIIKKMLWALFFNDLKSQTALISLILYFMAFNKFSNLMASVLS